MTTRSRIFLLSLTAMFPVAFAARALPPGTVVDEAAVPPYTLPDPLIDSRGNRVETAEAWIGRRRPEILELFYTHVYGRVPALATAPKIAVVEQTSGALDGLAVRTQVAITFPDAPKAPTMRLLVYSPSESSKPVPAFLGLNFHGNHSIHPDPAILLTPYWLPDKAAGAVDHRATDAGRGARVNRWPVETVLRRGYALATMYTGDIDPDFDDGFENGVHVLAKNKPAPDEWGSISAWAWGLSRCLDALATLPQIDSRKVAVLGHSRLGKTALWAGAADERFALVISNNSGCGGAALSRRCFGETVAAINKNFPHWFCDNFNRYSGNESALPVDQHMLLALVAPRPVYVASTTEDLWADPKGEFLAAKAAGPVYALFGKKDVGVEEQPPPDHPVGGSVGYHLRSGKHDLTLYDWERYLDFADRHLRGK